MSGTIRFILSLSILPAVIIGLIRFRKIDRSYHPFIFNIVLVLIIEIVHRVLLLTDYKQAINILQNFFSIIDFLLFLWLFHNWRLFNGSIRILLIIVIFYLLAWVGTNFFLVGITKPNFYFLALYAGTLVFFSITTFGKIIIQEQTYIFTNAKFWISLGVLIFYTFFIIICITQISLFNIKVSNAFQNYLQRINVYCNLLANILYAVAVLWIPQKKNYINLS